MRKLRVTFILLGMCVSLFALLAAGCGTKEPAKTGPISTASGTDAANGSSGSVGGAYKDTILKLGRIPFTNATEMVKKHEGLLNYLRNELGVKETRLVLASDYKGIIDKLARGEIDIGWLGSTSYVEAMADPKQKSAMRLLVKPRRFKTTSYRGIIIARQDSGIRKLTDLKGKKIAWVDKDSASGYLFPKALLLEAGVNPDKDFAEAGFLGKHDAVVLNVLLGKYDAGACYDDARNTLREKEKINELTILATTQDISNEPIVCRSDLPEDIIEKIKKAFMKLDVNDPSTKKVLEDCTDVQGFTSVQDSDYAYEQKVLTLLQGQK